MQFYDATDIHRLLVADEVRTSAFRNAIAAEVREGAVVLDVGAGSGILSLFAAQAGARRVYAVERAPNAAALARQLVADNGFAHIVHVIDADAAAVVLPERVDVIVSEWLGAYGVDENMLAPVLVARERWLKPGGTMIPACVKAWIAPVAHDAGRQSTKFHARPYGLDLSRLAPFSRDEVVWVPRGVAVDDLRAEPQLLWTIDCGAMPAADAFTPYRADLTFTLTGGGVNGLVTWFSAEMPGGGLSNAPGQPPTHWGQLLFPLAQAHQMRAGDELDIGFHNVPWGMYGSQHIWAARVNGSLEVHDTRRAWQATSGPAWRVYQPSGLQY